MTELIIVLAFALLVVSWAVGAYNRLLSLRTRFTHAFAQIDVQLKRRYDLIPILVEAAKNTMKLERETLETVIASRNQAVSANARAASDPTNAAAMLQMASSEGALTDSLGKMFALAKAYPELTANQNMRQLSEELAGAENGLAFARQSYNDSVIQYNAALTQFPGSMIANVFVFKPAEMLQAGKPAEKRQASNVGS